jgi:hypothetical protein
VLRAGVYLLDGEKREAHRLMRDWWFSHPAAEPTSVIPGCHVRKAINNRWALVVTARSLHPDADVVATWAARRLGACLPARSSELGYVPTGGGGGTSGSAELGIPVRWARKTR